MVLCPAEGLIKGCVRQGAAVLLAAALASAVEPPPVWRGALDQITAASLSGHVSFLASDLLEGRDTPSRGLDLAAEYIAAQFRRAGLEPAGDDGYFQTAKLTMLQPNPEGAELALRGPEAMVRAAPSSLVASCASELEVSGLPAVKSAADTIKDLKPEQVKGKALILDAGEPGKLAPHARRLSGLGAALIVVLLSEESQLSEARRQRLTDPEAPPPAAPPVLTVSDPALLRLARSDAPLTVSAACNARVQQPAIVRNVVGLLRGSDRSLADTAVVVSAHYDHVGKAAYGEGDRIYNGANDDASGTAAMIEIASVLAALPEKPKRSIVFAAFFGEERGMLGSRYYARRPVVPLDRTVANINIEQVGRPWPEDPNKRLRAWVTGYRYSDVVSVLKQAGEATGVELLRDARHDEEYFAFSDNIAFAEKGVPAHTVCTSFYFPDYHQPGDHWDKLDYGNMAGVTRMIALGALMTADSTALPRWNERNSKADKYRQIRGQ
ncbi:MAG: M20/M25/M40 family metallo-hydrolase [Bryobacteraceae bacterium]|nr:M20/M25/M40 family metallo-hydrolase [Bryobacteraceae bacterium]